MGLGAAFEVPLLGQRGCLGLRGEEVLVLTPLSIELRGEEVLVLTPLSIDGEFGEAVSECERLKTSSSRQSACFLCSRVETGARRGETVKVVGWWM